MKKADPSSRTYCKYGPAEGEKDVRRVDSPFNGMFHCQNVTMAQFADLLSGPWRGGDIKSRIVDKTGLTGSYDFSLSYTGASKLRLREAAAQAAAKQAGETSSGAGRGAGDRRCYSKRARRQAGEAAFAAATFLILDHINETPTEN